MRTAARARRAGAVHGSRPHTSGQIGAEKPHPRAFETVFTYYPDARTGWMIGDSWHADVQGAQGEIESIVDRG